MPKKLGAVLFDMDGVLTDSEHFIAQAAISMFAEIGLAVSREDFTPFIGSGEDRYLGGVAESKGNTIDLEKAKTRTYQLYDQIVHGRLKALHGVEAFIRKCRDMHLKLAVATSADSVKMHINLREIGIPATTFDATLSGEQVKRKKPYPDIYLMAASALRVAPENCLVVEDAINGIEAGKAAGCRCLAVTTSFRPEQLTLADWICDDLGNFPADALNW